MLAGCVIAESGVYGAVRSKLKGGFVRIPSDLHRIRHGDAGWYRILAVGKAAVKSNVT